MLTRFIHDTIRQSNLRQPIQKVKILRKYIWLSINISGIEMGRKKSEANINCWLRSDYRHINDFWLWGSLNGKLLWQFKEWQPEEISFLWFFHLCFHPQLCSKKLTWRRSCALISSQVEWHLGSYLSLPHKQFLFHLFYIFVFSGRLYLNAEFQERKRKKIIVMGDE